MTVTGQALIEKHKILNISTSLGA